MKKIIQILIIIFPTYLFSQTVETFVSDTSAIETIIHEPDDTLYIIKNFTDGHWLVYYDRHKKKKALDITIKNKVPFGTTTYWYRNGQLKEQTKESETGDDFKHTSMEWYRDNAVKKKRTCPNDTCIDEYFYPNGKLKRIDKSSPYLCYTAEYCENGQLLYSPFNQNATKKVQVTRFYCNGNKEAQLYWVAGAYAGDYLEWNENGTPRLKGQYEDDQVKIDTILHSHWVSLEKIGTWQYFDTSGKLTKEEYYENGKLIKTVEK